MNCLKMLLFILGIMPFILSCSKDNPEPVEAKIVVAQQEMTFSKTGGTDDLYIQSNVALDVKSSDESWCRVAQASTTSTSTLKYTVSVSANPATDDRSTTITVKGGNLTETVQVTQKANDGLIIEQTTYNDIAATGADIVIKLTANGDVTATSNASWITQSTLRSMTDRIMTFTVSANYGDAREGTITFSLGNLRETVTVKQLAVEILDIGMNSDALTLASKMYAGWNIGNTLEAIGGETAWGNPKITESYVKALKNLGFNAIRIPCSWDQYIENTTTYKIKDSWLDRVNEVVGYCVNNDMYAIVNIHWDGGWLENNCTPDKQDANNKKQQALWTQIANKLNHYDEHLLFAGTNEPNVDNDAAKMVVLKSYLQTFIDAVRATGGYNAVRNLIVQGPNTDIAMTNTLFGSMPADVVKNRLMVEVHYYNPWTFCGMSQDESWGRMAYYWGDYKVPGSDRNATFGDETEMKGLFAQMKTKFVDKGIPVILGEYGAITIHTGIDNQEAHDLSRQQYDRTVTRDAKNYGLVPFYWETGGVIDRNTGNVKKSYDFNGIMEGAAEGKYPY